MCIPIFIHKTYVAEMIHCERFFKKSRVKTKPQIIPRLNCSLVHFIIRSYYISGFVEHLGAKTELVFIRAVRSLFHRLYCYPFYPFLHLRWTRLYEEWQWRTPRQKRETRVQKTGKLAYLNMYALAFSPKPLGGILLKFQIICYFSGRLFGKYEWKLQINITNENI